MRKFQIILLVATLLSLPAYAVKTKTKIVKAPSIKRITIEAQGFLKTEKAEIISCAGENVYLIKKENEDILKKSASKRGSLSFKEDSSRLDYQLATIKREGNPDVSTEFKKLIEEYPNANFSYSNDPIEYHFAIKKAKRLEGDYLRTNIVEKSFTSTTCDMNGNIVFKNIPYGEYIIATTIRWNKNVPSLIYGQTTLEMTETTLSSIIKVDENLQKIMLNKESY